MEVDPGRWVINTTSHRHVCAKRILLQPDGDHFNVVLPTSVSPKGLLSPRAEKIDQELALNKIQVDTNATESQISERQLKEEGFTVSTNSSDHLIREYRDARGVLRMQAVIRWVYDVDLPPLVSVRHRRPVWSRTDQHIRDILMASQARDTGSSSSE
jgi:hypothetical protein